MDMAGAGGICNTICERKKKTTTERTDLPPIHPPIPPSEEEIWMERRDKKQ